MTPPVWKRESRGLRKERAFTLVEILVVCAVVGMLAALCLPAFSRFAGEGQRAAMMNQMRQLGQAVVQYAGENDGTLPGPLWSGQAFRYKKGKTEALLTHIGPYLGKPVMDGQWHVMEEVMTLSQRKFIRGRDTDDGSLFVITVDGSVKPFGYADKLIPPMKLHAIESPGSTEMFRELDQQASWANPKSGYYAKCPPAPLHGTMRHVSYFDGSVRGIAKSESDRK